MKLLCCLAVSLWCIDGKASAADALSVVLGDAHRNEEAVRVVVEDLRRACADLGISLAVLQDGSGLPQGDVIVAGDATRNHVTAELLGSGRLSPANSGSPEGYAVRTLHQDDRRIWAVMGGSVIGDVYGLYWIWDRLRVHRRIPDLDVVRAPAFPVRLGAAWGRNAYGGSTREQMQAALRYSFNWVAGPGIPDLVPWDAEPEASENARNRAAARELIAYAHSLHMKYFSFGNAYVYHPSILETHGASLSPCDPRFWDAVQETYRRLFRALPELDGICLCNDDISGFWGRYLPFDLTREAPECDWSYVKRFHTFVSKVHDVAVGEFGKTYFHFTWGLREHEVHCQPEVFRAIFTDAIPTDNLYLMPKITRADRWWHQPYNATFNQTPHHTVVLFEPMNYYESGVSHLFPTFSGQYFQRGLQTFLLPEDSNVRGVAALAGAPRDAWGTTAAYAYVLYRLMWDPNEDMARIARDFCAIHFGEAAADAMARVYLLTPSAYQYGLHIEPISYGQFNSFLHMRVGVFPAEGYPAIDGGKEHLNFLRRVYLRCDPWRAETMRALEQGLHSSEAMLDVYRREAAPRLADPALAQELENRLQMTRRLIRTNIGYVDVMFAYFDYVDRPGPETHASLTRARDGLAAARAEFMSTPNFDYKLFGVDALLHNANAAIENPAAAAARLARMPDRRELEALIAERQRRYREVLEERRAEAVPLARFEILVDGQDLVILSGGAYRIENIRWDGAQVEVGEILTPLPERRVTVIPKDIESRPMHPFVLEQPSAENGYAVRIYLDDAPGGHGWMKFDLYYVDAPPEALGLQVPWDTGGTP